MLTVAGLVLVFACVLGGFALVGGPMALLFQPAELLIIGGAAVGTLIAGAPGRMRSRVFGAFGKAFRETTPSREDYVELIKLQYELLSFMRRNGAVALDEHVTQPYASSIFQKYPSFLARTEAVDFFCDALAQIVNGTATAEELELLLESELETHREETAIPVGLLKSTGDALPGLGIVAAVLCIIVTMGNLDASPEIIGQRVAAALVGTLLGILLCYGLLHPVANAVELHEVAASRYLRCIKEAVVASLRGAAPIVAVEFARKAIFADERPTSAETDAACKAVKATMTFA